MSKSIRYFKLNHQKSYISPYSFTHHFPKLNFAEDCVEINRWLNGYSGYLQFNTMLNYPKIKKAKHSK